MISAKILADSVSEYGDRITTFELEYPRFIHSELLTHRVFSRNSASSRAIPIDKTIEGVLNSLAMPVEWGVNRPGMQAEELHSDPQLCQATWEEAVQSAAVQAEELAALGLHKQIVNRVLEPFLHMKTVLTGTEFDNFFALRTHGAAQPEFRALAIKMKDLYQSGTPRHIKTGQWHVPYHADGVCLSYDEDAQKAARMVSASCCAQVSYRKTDCSLEKAKRICDRLLGATPIHASPFEHQATPMNWGDTDTLEEKEWPSGATHMDTGSRLWSGNLKGWIQNRQLLEGEY